MAEVNRQVGEIRDQGLNNKNMNQLFTKKQYFKTNNGYAMLFTVVVVSIVATIAMGLSGSAYKQVVLSAVAKDSQSAFYQSDTAVECALYADFKLGGPVASTKLSSGSWKCGKDNSLPWKDVTLYLDTQIVTESNYGFLPFSPDSAGSVVRSSCFEFDVNKSDPTKTVVKARGYNNCDKRDPKTVEREIEVNY